MSKPFQFQRVPLSDLGYLGIPQKIKNENHTFRLDDCGCKLVHDSASAHTYTFDYNLVQYLDDFTATVVNHNGAGIVTVAVSPALTMYLAGAGTTGSRQVAANGIATFTFYRLPSGLFNVMANGTGLT